MIVTITLNPSLDYIIHVADFQLGVVNRTDEEKILPGGKGINVATVLTNLGHSCLAIGFAAGNSGKTLRRELMMRGIEADLIEAESGFTRVNIKMKGDPETQINGMGPKISEKNMAFLEKSLSRLTPNDILVVSGSVPSCLSRHTYADIAALVEKRGCRLIVDAEGELLTETLAYHPFLIKPNRQELEAVIGESLQEVSQVVKAAHTLQDRGARNVLVSLGETGAVLVSEDGEEYFCKAPQVDVVNTVGSGDSAVAGFISGYVETGSMSRALMKAVACGSASAASEELAEREEVEKLLRTIYIENLK